MSKISELRSILCGYFTWHKSRLNCFLHILVGLFMVRSVNLKEIAVAVEGQAQLESRYRRIKAFFTDFKINYLQIARWIFQQFHSGDKKLYLTIDRTNWYFGKAKINVFMLAIAHEGVAIPIYWKMLNKAGNSRADEQIKLIAWFVRHFGLDCIEGVLGDREFGNKALMSWMAKNKIPFYIRVKEKMPIKLFKQSKQANLKKLFKKVNNKSRNYYPYSVFIGDQRLFVAAGRSEKGELLIVATNSDVKNAVPIYLRRWEIECLFHALKTRGFHFENTHLTDRRKIAKLIAILAVGVAWAVKAGEWKAESKPIPMNQHRDSLRPQNTFFRYGLDFIRKTLMHCGNNIKKLRQCLFPIDMQYCFSRVNESW